MPSGNSETRCAALLRAARERQALTDEALGALIGRSKRQIIRWENSQALPPLDLIRVTNGEDKAGLLAVALDIPWQRLAKARARDLQDRRRIRLLGAEACA